MRNPLNRPMLAVLMAAGVISLLDSDESRAEVRFAPLVRNGHEVGLKVLRGKRFPAAKAPDAPRRMRARPWHHV